MTRRAAAAAPAAALAVLLAGACSDDRPPPARAVAPPDAPPAVPAPPAAARLWRADEPPRPLLSVPSLTLRAAHRAEGVPLRVDAPDPGASAAALPVIVWSHGANGSRDGYDPLALDWAAHGYCVVRPTHGDSLSLASREELAAGRDLLERTSSPTVLRHWRTRPLDVRRVLDGLDEIERALSARAGHPVALDRARVGVGGHSFGAWTTLVVAGARLYGPGGRVSVSFLDTRPRAFVAVSPQGEGGGLRDASWAGLVRPTLFVSGSEDTLPIDPRPASSRRAAFDGAAPGAHELVWIEGAHHGFGGITGSLPWAGSGPADPAQVAVVRAVALAWWDAHVRDDADAAAWLASDALVRAAGVALRVERR